MLADLFSFFEKKTGGGGGKPFLFCLGENGVLTILGRFEALNALKMARIDGKCGVRAFFFHS